MSTTFEDVRKRVGTQVTKYRWAIGLNGLLSIAFGIVIIVWPGISLFSLVIVFGAFSLARGIIGLTAAIGGGVRQDRGWLALMSLAAIAVGVIVFLRTDISALALLYVIGAYAIGLGFLAIVGAFRLPLDGADSVILGLTGVVSILFGIVMFAKPGDGALVLLALIAAYALIFGIAEVTVAIGWKNLVERATTQRRRSVTASPKPQPTR
jgi:uncharacterized membrane protein HdeD (DUF308 family)